MGVGMPQALLLHEFGSQVWAAFGAPPYHVGSSLALKSGWRDVDVRLILADDEYDRIFGRALTPDQEFSNERWVALCRAFSALGRDMTGLPIDFQIQRQTDANAAFDGPRSCIGRIPLRVGQQNNSDAQLSEYPWLAAGAEKAAEENAKP